MLGTLIQWFIILAIITLIAAYIHSKIKRNYDEWYAWWFGMKALEARWERERNDAASLVVEKPPEPISNPKEMVDADEQHALKKSHALTIWAQDRAADNITNQIISAIHPCAQPIFFELIHKIVSTEEVFKYPDEAYVFNRLAPFFRDEPIHTKYYIDALSKLSTHLASFIPETSRPTPFTVPFKSVVNVRQTIQVIFETFLERIPELLAARTRVSLRSNLLHLTDRGYPYWNDDKTHPKNSKLDDASLIETYLAGTIFESLFSLPVPIVIPDEKRFEHTWILAPQGTGKTQLLKTLIAADLPKVQKNEASVLIIDSKNEIIPSLIELEYFRKGGALDGKLMIIDPDPDYPPALNIFDMGRMPGKLTNRQKEELENTTYDLLTQAFASLLGEGGKMTDQQETLFSYALQLVLQIPFATLETLNDILSERSKDGIQKKYAHIISKFDHTTQTFFASAWSTDQYKETKSQISRRIFSMLKRPTFRKMFINPRSKIDLFTELQSSKIICLNTSKGLLGEQQSALLGRYFIALLLIASQKRMLLSRENRLPTYVYVDEAHEYIKDDEKVAQLMDQARSSFVGMHFAHQRMTQITSDNVKDALKTTGIKFISTDNTDDQRALAPSMKLEPSELDQPEQHFALNIRRTTQKAVSVKVPFFVMEKAKNKLSTREQDELMQENRERYSGVVHETGPDDPYDPEPYIYEPPPTQPILNLLPAPDGRTPQSDW